MINIVSAAGVCNPSYNNLWEVPHDLATAKAWRWKERAVRRGAKRDATILLKGKPVPLYSFEKTNPCPLSDEQKAIDEFWHLFAGIAPKIHIRSQYSPEVARWWTEDRRLTSRDVTDHIAGVGIVGVIAYPKSRWSILDSDLHIGKDKHGWPILGNPEVFLAMADVLLHHFLGRDTWHVSMKRRDISGLHLIQVGELESIVHREERLRSELRGLDELHPDLKAEAERHGMKSFSEIEIFPNVPQPGSLPHGVRLPLGLGRQPWLDQPMECFPDGREDVIAYMDWIKDADRQYVHPAIVLDYLRKHVARPRPRIDLLAPVHVMKVKVEDANVQPSTVEKADLNAEPSSCIKLHIPEAKALGDMKNNFGDLFARLRRGLLPGKSLDHVVFLYCKLLHVAGYDFEAIVEIVLRELRKIDNTAFSSRLDKGDTKALNRMAKKRAKDAETKLDDEQRDILKRVVVAWDNQGIDFTDLDSFWLKGEQQFHAQTTVADVALPVAVQDMIKKVAGRAKVMEFAQRLVGLLYSNRDGLRIHTKQFYDLLGYKNPSRLTQYKKIMEKAGILDCGHSYLSKHSSKLYKLTPETLRLIDREHQATA